MYDGTKLDREMSKVNFKEHFIFVLHFLVGYFGLEISMFTASIKGHNLKEIR